MYHMIIIRQNSHENWDHLNVIRFAKYNNLWLAFYYLDNVNVTHTETIEVIQLSVLLYHRRWQNRTTKGKCSLRRKSSGMSADVELCTKCAMESEMLDPTKVDKMKKEWNKVWDLIRRTLTRVERNIDCILKTDFESDFVTLMIPSANTTKKMYRIWDLRYMWCEYRIHRQILPQTPWWFPSNSREMCELTTGPERTHRRTTITPRCSRKPRMRHFPLNQDK